jgi:hypothetical protein
MFVYKIAHGVSPWGKGGRRNLSFTTSRDACFFISSRFVFDFLASPSPTVRGDGEARKLQANDFRASPSPQRKKAQAKAVTAAPLPYAAGAGFAATSISRFVVAVVISSFWLRRRAEGHAAPMG